MLRLVLALITLAAPALARADEWSHTAELQSASTASIRVVEPEGYHVTVNERTDAAPAVFAVPNADNYIVLGVRAPSGATWERKIEVKAYRQTVVRIRHVAARADKPPPARGASYIGVVANTLHLCKKAADRRDIRLVFVLGADEIKTVDVKLRSRTDVELPGGQYRVRRFVQGASGWEYASTLEYAVEKDGWVYQWGCS